MKNLFLKHYNQLLYYGGKFIKDRYAVEDIVSETFLWYYRKGYKDERVLYLFVKRRCLNYIRDCKCHQSIEIDESLLKQPIENEIIECEFLNNIHLCIDKLPPESRIVIEKFYFEKKRCDEIGIEINKPASTVRSAKRYALKVLRELLKKKLSPL